MKDEYREHNKEVKRSARRVKREYRESILRESEIPAIQNDLRTTLYKTTKNMSRKPLSTQPREKNEEKILKNEREIIERWVEHFSDR